MKLIVAGVGPGDPGLVTLKALRAAKEADLVLVPHSRLDRPSVAEAALRAHVSDLKTAPVLFPMTGDAEARDASLRARLVELQPLWKGTKTALLPVIGDSALYATGAYLYDLWKELVPNLELELIPGVSAHSLAAARARRFLALGTDVLSLIPGTARPEQIAQALGSCDSAALYKPSALGERLAPVVNGAGPWREILRVDRAGLEDERILSGVEALEPAREYLSTLLLWR